MITTLLIVLIGALGITALCHRAGVRSGLVIVVVAGVVSFIPGIPRLQLPPDLILTLVIPPLLYSAAVHFSILTFLRHLRVILALGVGLVVATAVSIGLFTWWLAPGLGLGGAFVLAAVVSPPDSVTTVRHGRELGLPKRVVAILTGESLVNDAAALTILAVAVAAVTGEHTFIGNPALLFLYELGAGLGAGVALGFAVVWIRQRLGNPTLECVLGLALPFAAYLLASQFHASGVLAVVAAGFTVGAHTSLAGGGRGVQNYRTRLQEREIWPIADTVLESFVFAYMGLQFRFVIEDLMHTSGSRLDDVGLGLTVLMAVMLVRVVVVCAAFGRLRLLRAPAAFVEPHASTDRLSGREILLVSWTGMRGIVTLAAAAGLPLTVAGEQFHGRELIQVVAYIVALGTLLIQGVTLPLLARHLRIDVSSEYDWEAAETARGLKIVSDVGSGDFDRQRAMIVRAVRRRQLNDEIGDDLLHHIDLQQAAAESNRGHTDDRTPTRSPHK
jgi:CPA1 family monovalent cation:H+ antiporter